VGDAVERVSECAMPPLDGATKSASVSEERGLYGPALALEPYKAAGALAARHPTL
jgi:hypothetical protein